MCWVVYSMPSITPSLSNNSTAVSRTTHHCIIKDNCYAILPFIHWIRSIDMSIVCIIYLVYWLRLPMETSYPKTHFKMYSILYHRHMYVYCWYCPLYLFHLLFSSYWLCWLIIANRLIWYCNYVCKIGKN